MEGVWFGVCMVAVVGVEVAWWVGGGTDLPFERRHWVRRITNHRHA